MRPAPDIPARLRAPRPAAPPVLVWAAGRAGPIAPVLTAAAAMPVRARGRWVLAAGLGMSALGHAALALWLAQIVAVPPPDGPPVPATEVMLLSGAQFSALTAPAPQPPDPAPQPPSLPREETAPDAPTPDQVARPQVRAAALLPLPAADTPPDPVAQVSAPPAPGVAVRLPELAAPELSETGVQVPASAPNPVPTPAPDALDPPESADHGPVLPQAAPPPPKAKPAPKPARPKAGAEKPASAAGDGGSAETTQRAAKGATDARATWLSAIRARVERRKTYPAGVGAEGRVTLQLTVDRSGRLAAVGVLRTSGNALLDAAALRAVRSAGQFPKAPESLAEASVTFNLPLRFTARP